MGFDMSYAPLGHISVAFDWAELETESRQLNLHSPGNSPTWMEVLPFDMDGMIGFMHAFRSYTWHNWKASND
jgi:hypothetical protein